VAEKPDFRCDASGPDARYGIDGTTAAESCPMACGTCAGECADSTSWTHNGDPNKDCPWVSDDASERCPKKDESGVSAYTACQRTCGTCDDPVCIESAGYSWCPELGQCVQIWELPDDSPCAQPPEVDDDHGCSSYSVWCEEKDKCILPWIEPCGTVDHDCNTESTGYEWCPLFQRCTRPWEEPCVICADSTSWRKHNNENIGCEQVAEDPAKFCDKFDVDDVYAYDACPSACGTCENHGCIADAGHFWCPQTGRCEQLPLPPFSPCRNPYPPVGSYQDSWVGRSTNSVGAADAEDGADGMDGADMVGGNADDEHECCHSCGYSWCNSGGDNGEGACERPWIDPCESGPCGTNSETWHKKDDESKDCKWVAATNTEKRCAVKGEDKVLASYACPNACGTASCGDDVTWHKRDEPEKTCAWVSVFPRKRCFVRSDDKTMAKVACPIACRNRGTVKALTRT
jgi:hypothetical protein